MKDQNEFPIEGEGVSRKVIKPLENAIAKWSAAKAERMLLTEKEVKAKESVKALLVEHGIKCYRFEDDNEIEKEVYFDESVKTRKVKPAENEEEEED